MHKSYLIISGVFLLGFLWLGFWAKGNVEQMPLVISAAINEDLAALEQAIEDGEDVNAVGPMGVTAMVFAIRKKNLPMVQFLVESGYDLDRPIGRKDALLIAQETGDAAILRYLESVMLLADPVSESTQSP